MLKPKRRWTKPRIIFFLKRGPYGWLHLRFREKLYVTVLMLLGVTVIMTVFGLLGIDPVKAVQTAFTGFVDSVRGR